MPSAPSYDAALERALAGPDSGILSTDPSLRRASPPAKMRTLTLLLVFVVSVGIGLTTTLLLFR